MYSEKILTQQFYHLILIFNLTKMYKLKISVFSSIILHVLTVFIFMKNLLNNNPQIKLITKNIIDSSVFIDLNTNINKKDDEKLNNKNIKQHKKIFNSIDQLTKQTIKEHEKPNSKLEKIKEVNLKKKLVNNVKNNKKICSEKKIYDNKNTKFNILTKNIANNKNLTYNENDLEGRKYQNIKSQNNQDIKDKKYYQDINTYQASVNKSISEKFYNYDHYIGKSCDLHLKIDSNGKLVSVSVKRGDKELCQAALLAIKIAEIPKPPSKKIYELFKDTIIRFLPS